MLDATTDIDVICNRLNDKNVSLKDRFRALFSLRNLGGKRSIDSIFSAFDDASVLLQHELAFCLGQMQDEYAITKLISIIEDETLDSIVRHEAGEALGAIGKSEYLDVLKYYSTHFIQEVSETCHLAIGRINWLNDPNRKDLCSKNPFNSIDPAPPSAETDIAKLQSVLLNEDLPLFERYSSMFALRNIGSDNCIIALTEGLKCKNSALFRHEVAYVLGQTQSPLAISSLTNRLSDSKEHPMVRHEAAEALGAIATDECIRILHQYITDPERIVRESCIVALDISEHELSNNFQYAFVST